MAKRGVVEYWNGGVLQQDPSTRVLRAVASRHCAKRLECAQLAAAVERGQTVECLKPAGDPVAVHSGSKLRALQTLRAVRLRPRCPVPYLHVFTGGNVNSTIAKMQPTTRVLSVCSLIASLGKRGNADQQAIIEDKLGCAANAKWNLRHSTLPSTTLEDLNRKRLYAKETFHLLGDAQLLDGNADTRIPAGFFGVSRHSRSRSAVPGTIDVQIRRRPGLSGVGGFNPGHLVLEYADSIHRA